LTKRLVRPALRAILEAIEGVENATRGKTLDDYGADWLLRHGVQRGIEIVSEAARPFPLNSKRMRRKFPGRRSWESAMCCGMNITESPTR
jgi:uncharacterized protein with HEPN domain